MCQLSASSRYTFQVMQFQINSISVAIELSPFHNDDYRQRAINLEK
jgi:hypothetical protein